MAAEGQQAHPRGGGGGGGTGASERTYLVQASAGQDDGLDGPEAGPERGVGGRAEMLTRIRRTGRRSGLVRRRDQPSGGLQAMDASGTSPQQWWQTGWFTHTLEDFLFLFTSAFTCLGRAGVERAIYSFQLHVFILYIYLLESMFFTDKCNLEGVQNVC